MDDSTFIPLKVVLKILDSLSTAVLSTDTSLIKRHKPNPVMGPFPLSNSAGQFDVSLGCNNQDIQQEEIHMVKEEERNARNIQATKNDDAPIPIYLFHEAVVPDSNPIKIRALTCI